MVSTNRLEICVIPNWYGKEAVITKIDNIEFKEFFPDCSEAVRYIHDNVGNVDFVMELLNKINVSANIEVFKARATEIKDELLLKAYS